MQLIWLANNQAGSLFPERLAFKIVLSGVWSKMSLEGEYGNTQNKNEYHPIKYKDWS